MVPSLEYLARNVVFETNIHKNQFKYKHYMIVDENIDQYAQVVSKKFPLLTTHKLSVDTLLVIRLTKKCLLLQ